MNPHLRSGAGPARKYGRDTRKRKRTEREARREHRVWVYRIFGRHTFYWDLAHDARLTVPANGRHPRKAEAWPWRL